MNIDELVIEVESTSDGASQEIDRLIKALNGLKTAVAGSGRQLTNLSKGLQDVALANKQLNNLSFNNLTTNIKKLTTALQPLSGYKTQATGLINALKGIDQAVGNLNAIDSAEFKEFGDQITILTEKIKPLNEISGKLGATLKALGSVGQVASGLRELNSAISSPNGGVTADTGFSAFARDIQKLSDSLRPLQEIKSSLGATINALTRFQQVANSLSGTDFSKFSGSVKQLTDALMPLADIGKSNLNSALNAIKKVHEVADSLSKTDLGKFEQQIKRVTVAIKPLADEMNKVAAGFAALPSKIQRVIYNMEKVSGSTKNASNSFNSLINKATITSAKLGVLYIAFSRIVSVLADCVNESNDYVENLNLFTVAMGKNAQGAKEYAEAFTSVYGLDPSQFMRYQGVFQAITTGFGVASDKASLMSKNLTTLGYDIASFYNLDFDTAMEKLQSGLAGELEPLRRLGYALDEATLQQVAYANGIDMNIRKMTQAQKSQLRYLAIMQQSGKAMGDLSRTSNTTTAQLRVLNQQVTMLKRALGNLMVPLLNAILPHLTAMIIALTDILNMLAELVGFKLPEIDYSGMEMPSSDVNDLSDSFDSLADSIENATDKFKPFLASFDEINRIPSQNEDKDKDISDGFDLGVSLPEYDPGIYDDSKIKKLAEAYKKWLIPLLATLAALKGLIWLLKKLKKNNKDNTKEVKKQSKALDKLEEALDKVSKAAEKAKKKLKDTFKIPGGFPVPAPVPIPLPGRAPQKDPQEKPQWGPTPQPDPIPVPAMDLSDFLESIKKYQMPIAPPQLITAIAPALALAAFLPSVAKYQQSIAAPIVMAAMVPALDMTMFTPSLELAKANLFAFADAISIKVTEWTTQLNASLNLFGFSVATIFATNFANAYNSVSMAFTNMGLRALEFASGMQFNLQTAFQNVNASINEWALNAQTQFTTTFAWITMQTALWGENTKLQFFTTLDNLKQKAVEASGNLIIQFSTLFENLRIQTSLWGSSTQSNFGIIMSGIATTVAVGAGNAQGAFNGFLSQTGNSVGTWAQDVGTQIASFFDGVVSKIGQAVGSVVSKIQEMWSKYTYYWNKGAEAMGGPAQAIGKSALIGAGIGGAAISGAGIATGAVGAAGSAAGALGWISKITPVFGFASGGFPTTGQLFYARENGIPEMVGTVGGKSAVANNTQIEDAISVAVYKAVLSAMQSAGGSTNGQPMQITVNVGEDTLVNKIIKGINDESRRQGQVLINV